MSIVTLAEVKSHLRIDHDEDDADLLLYIAAAEQSVENFLNRPLSDPGEHGSPFGSPNFRDVPEPIKHAIKMLVATMFEHREDIIVGTIVAVNPTVERLLFPYRACLGV